MSSPPQTRATATRGSRSAPARAPVTGWAPPTTSWAKSSAAAGGHRLITTSHRSSSSYSISAGSRPNRSARALLAGLRPSGHHSTADALVVAQDATAATRIQQGGREVTSGQWSPSFATRAPRGGAEFGGNGTVAASVDQKEKWPRRPALSKPGGATWPTDLVVGVRKPAEHPFREKEGADVIRVPVPVTRHTAPRRGGSSHARCWSFDGAFVLSARTPIRPSTEGVGMT
jgi:hypothetical protein